MIDPFMFFMMVMFGIYFFAMMTTKSNKNDKEQIKMLVDNAPKIKKSPTYNTERVLVTLSCPVCGETPIKFEFDYFLFGRSLSVYNNFLNLLKSNDINDPKLVESLDLKLELLFMYEKSYMDILKTNGYKMYEIKTDGCKAKEKKHTCSYIESESNNKAKDYYNKATELKNELSSLYDQMNDIIIERKKIANNDSDNYIKIMIEANKEANKMFLGFEDKKEGESK